MAAFRPRTDAEMISSNARTEPPAEASFYFGNALAFQPSIQFFMRPMADNAVGAFFLEKFADFLLFQI